MEKNNKIALVFDCGATNLRVIAMDTEGQIVASKSMSNETDDDPNLPNGKIWDVQKLWKKFSIASKEVVSKIDREAIVGVTVTTFGVDGTWTDASGKLLYPVISWQCPRLQPVMQQIDKYMPVEELYRISGVFPFAFNTISKMVWFKEHRPDILDHAAHFLFLPSLFLKFLGAAGKNDVTMMGTSMMADLKKRQFSPEILEAIGLQEHFSDSPGEPGECIGKVSREGSDDTGIPQGVPLFLTGHDTQFAIFGSGADLQQPVLSSGTWEILMARSNTFTSSTSELRKGLTTEADVFPGHYTIGQNWLGSGVLEWFSRNFYPGLEGDELYQTMIGEAENVSPQKHGLLIDPDFLADGDNSGGVIRGLTISSTKGEIYRALLESLAFRLRESMEVLQEAGSFKSDKIICVGGGSKNNLWNQIRADVCKVPLQLIGQKETTVLGAALFVFSGAGIFRNPKEARVNIDYRPVVVEPREKYKEIYDNRFNAYQKLKRNR